MEMYLQLHDNLLHPWLVTCINIFLWSRLLPPWTVKKIPSHETNRQLNLTPSKDCLLKTPLNTKTGPQHDRLITDLRLARTIQGELLPHLPTASALIACNLAFAYTARFLHQRADFDSADQSDSVVDRVLNPILDIVYKVPVGNTALHTILLWPVFQVGLSAKVRATQDAILAHFSNIKGNGGAALKLKLREVWGRKD